jgi:hypothetical protein
MAGIFDSIPLITLIMFAIGLVGVIVYEKTRNPTTNESVD